MPVLDASHDFAHEVEGDSAWSESYYFNAYDPAVDAGHLHPHRRAAQRGHDRRGAVGVAPGRPHRQRAGRPRADRDDRRATSTWAGVRYQRLEPMHRWRLTADADAEVLDLGGDVTPGTGRPGRRDDGPDVRRRSSRPSAPTAPGRSQRSDASAASTASTVGKGHLEQSGTWEGTIGLDGDDLAPRRRQRPRQP